MHNLATRSFFFLITEGCLNPLGHNNPYGLKGSRVSRLWPQCGSVVLNAQLLSVNRGTRPTELPLKISLRQDQLIYIEVKFEVIQLEVVNNWPHI